MEVIIETTEELNQEYANAIKQTLVKEINDRFSSQLKLNDLDKIVASLNFGVSLNQFQEENGLPVEHTNDKLAQAVAKTLHLRKDNQVKSVIFIRLELILEMFLEENTGYGYHFLHHELCHVHDDWNKEYLMKDFIDQYRKDTGSELQNILLRHSMTIWSEYIAVRLSSESYPRKEFDFFIPHLFNLIRRAKEEIPNEIDNYRFNGDINKLFIRAQELINPVMKFTATVLGYIHGLNINNEAILDGLDNTFIIDIWTQLDKEFNRLFNSYPDWESIDQFDILNSLILSVLNDFGIYPEDTSVGLYISVP